LGERFKARRRVVMGYVPTISAGSYYRPSVFGGFRFFPPVIKWLLLSNTAVYLLFNILLAPLTLHGVAIFDRFAAYLALWPLGTHFYPWQLVTYLFLHGGFLHLFFNMLALWMFGMELEHVWGSKRFLTYYLLCGIGGGLSNLLVAPLIGQVGPTVGASGAIFGVLLAFGILFPDRPIYLYFLLPIRAKYFVTFYIGLELVLGVTGSPDGIAHFAHLGGAAVGFLYLVKEMHILKLRKRAEVRVGGDWSFRRAPSTGQPEVRDAKFYDLRTGRSLEEEEPITQEVVDAILDKISKGGYQSLNDREKRILNEASKKIH
jgi:membrane associated rhomboid family serine protease